MSPKNTLFYSAAVFITLAAGVGLSTRTTATKPQAVTKDPVHVAQIEVGPFDIHRKYRSMEGPYVSDSFKVDDIVSSGKVVIPESMVKYVETWTPPPMSAPKQDDNSGAEVVRGSNKKSLYWVKGIKLQVLDENNKPLPTAEFICHLNVDVPSRSKIFKDAENGSTRLFTLTQGQTEFHFPEGYAVPVASNEEWEFTFQAANRTTNAHRRIKHLCSVEFVKDSELTRPIKALSWYSPYIAVVIGENAAEAAPAHHGPSCLATSTAEHAPNMVPGSTIADAQKRKLTGHWAIPPGEHSYTAPITDERDRGFSSKDRIVHAVWSHVHPLCTETSLIMCDGANKTTLFSVGAKTDSSKGLEIEHIDNICSEKGILLPAGKQYELNCKYNNVTGKAQDSMVVEGIFFEDDQFVKPSWNSQVADSSVPKRSQFALVDYDGTDRYALFNPQADGPLLAKSKVFDLATSEGRLHLILDPSIAPEHATQMYKLLKAGAFNDTTIFRYQPDFIMQVASVDMKRSADLKLSSQNAAKLRRLPLEVGAQEYGKGLHKKWALTMARSKADDSAVSSFSILLADAPHLDHNFTVFGYVVPDKVSTATMKKLTAGWSKSQRYIVGVKEVDTGSISSTAIASKDEGKHNCNSLYCGIKPTQEQTPEAEVARVQPSIKEYPAFNTKVDGPILSSSKSLEMKTSAGNLRIVLDPGLAPKNASQMYRLFKAGIFQGTVFSRYEPNFVLQTALAETKMDGNSKFPERMKRILRDLPLETSGQDHGRGLHKKWALTMAHGDDPNSAVSSFSILLADAPHLDHKYTVFGRVVNDSETMRTLEKITSQWSTSKPYILSVSDAPPSIASAR